MQGADNHGSRDITTGLASRAVTDSFHARLARLTFASPIAMQTSFYVLLFIVLASLIRLKYLYGSFICKMNRVDYWHRAKRKQQEYSNQPQ